MITIYKKFSYITNQAPPPPANLLVLGNLPLQHGPLLDGVSRLSIGNVQRLRETGEILVDVLLQVRIETLEE